MARFSARRGAVGNGAIRLAGALAAAALLGCGGYQPPKSRRPPAPADVVGTWRCRTQDGSVVEVRFARDGTFRQTITQTGWQGLKGQGTWRLSGPDIRMKGLIDLQGQPVSDRTWWVTLAEQRFWIFGGFADDMDDWYYFRQWPAAGSQ